MRTRSFVAATAAVLVITACGGGSDDADDSLPQITLITTTTSLPPFDPSDSVVDGADDGNESSPETSPETSAPSDPAPSDPAPTDPAPSDPAPSDPPPSESTDAAGPTTLPVETAPSSAPETTASSTPSATADFSLQTDGLGAVSFGANPDGVITFVTSFLGGASADTGWVDPFTIGACGGTQLRQVTWGDLQLEFGDVSNIAEGRPHFYAYYYGKEGLSSASPAGLATDEGISVGSSVAQLLQAYPGVQLRSGNEFVNDSFFINDNLTGRLSGLADPDLVQMVIGGIPCES